MSSFFRDRIFPSIVSILYRLWFTTWKIEIYDSEAVKKLSAEKKPWVMAMWHGDELATATFCRFYKSATMISTSKDGDLMNGVLTRLGMKTSRGSSTRGGSAALKGLIRLTREGYSPLVSVDGPKGPYHKAKPGIFEVAKICHLPIIPMGVACSRKKVFERSWNKAFIPLPFARVCLVWGEAMIISDDADPRDEALARELENRLDAASRAAAKLFAKS